MDSSHYRLIFDLDQSRQKTKLCMYVCMYVFNFFRDAILISYTAGFHEGRLFSYLQVYKNEKEL